MKQKNFKMLIANFALCIDDELVKSRKSLLIVIPAKVPLLAG
jgi:hypothetical protein